MTVRPFVHLHCHTHYSLLDGASRVPELVAHVKNLGMNSVAITDHGNLYGAIEFYRECKSAGLNPILGYEAYVAPKHRTDREAKKRGDAGFHLTLLARDITGFRNLIRLSSRAYLEGYHYVPRIDKELLTEHKEGLICLSGCASSEFSEQILQGDLEGAMRIAREFSQLFGKHFYVEIQNNGLKIQRACAEGAIEVAQRLGLPLVATSDAHYLEQTDAPSHDVLLCINTGAKRSDARRMRYGDDGGGMIDQFYVRGPEAMYALFPEHEEAVKRTQEIANGVDIQIDFKKRHFPVFSPPQGKSPDAYLRELCEAGLMERYRGNPSEPVRQRLNLELDIICRMGFSSYFLIVGDFVRFAVEKGIPASARGSACGALVSYVLKLSHVDPLEYDLLFERFLDPNRAEAPDIDIDFCQERREEVIAYVKEKYGAESVAQIATFGTMAAKAAIKDVGRVLDVPLATVNQLASWVPQRLGVTLDDALKESPEFKQAYETDSTLHELIDIARRLEGTNRQAGIHAAGVVIANGPITDYVPVHRAIRKNEDGGRGGEPAVATQWVMGDLEKVGLLKMDFLGLRNLTLLNNCVKLIEKTRGIKIDLYNLPMDDPETYALLQRGDAKGVFQLESEGIRQLLTQMKPDNIRDLVAILALYRPGPLQGGMVDSYVNCKHGRETPVYQHPVMEEILAETYGVMVFQESIMRILNRLGGIELSSAYACIKAISKKKQDTIDQRHAEFVKGAQERGLDREAIDDIWNKIIVFAGYGFNKCLVGDTTIIHAETGERTTLEDLFQNRRPFVVHALAEDGKLRAREVEDVVWNGRRKVYRLRTAQGREITATDNHPFRTLDGWTLLRDLKPGSAIAAARRLPVSSWESWPRHEIRVGFQQSTHSNSVSVLDPRVATDLATSDIFWDRVVSIEPAGVHDTYDLTIAEDHNFVAEGLVVHNSHTAAYAQVGYQTAYLKAHFTAEFMAALLSSEADGSKRDMMVDHIADAKKLGAPVRQPDINSSETEFSVQGHEILFGLLAIKGLGRSAADAIVLARQEGGPFKDLFDFCERTDIRSVPRAAMEKLIKAGAFDRFGRRNQLWTVLPRAVQAASTMQRDKAVGQLSLFGGLDDDGPATATAVAEVLPDVPEWPDQEKLKYEKEVLDFYLSSHPLAQHEPVLRRFSQRAIDDLKYLPPGVELTVGGMLSSVRFLNTKNSRNGNTRYIRCNLEDMSGSIECLMWPDDFARQTLEVADEVVCFVKGAIDPRSSREKPLLLLTRFLSVEQAQRELTKMMIVSLRLGTHEPQHIDALARVLRRTPGSCPVLLDVRDGNGKWARLKLSDEYRINPLQVATTELEAMFGSGCVKFSGPVSGNGGGRG